MLFGNIIIIYPGSVGSGYHTLGTQDCTVLSAVQSSKDLLDVLCAVGVGCLDTPTGEYFVCVMVMMVVVMIMIVAAAGAVLVMLMMMLMVMVFIMVMMMVMLMLVLIMLMMMVMLMLVFIIVVIVVMSTAALMLVMVVMVMMLVVTALILIVIVMDMLQHFLHHIFQLVSAFDGLQYFPAIQLVKRSGDNGSLVVMLTDHLHAGIQLCLIHFVGSA